MKVYLAGPVPKGDEKAKTFYDWRNDYFSVIQQAVPDILPPESVIFFKLEGDSPAVMGADSLLIKECDFVVVNAETKIGAGTAMELVIAKYFTKPVISILPKDSHHRRSNLMFEGRVVKDWKHPFIETFSDCIIDDIKDFPKAVNTIKSPKIKTITVIDEAIRHAQSLLNKS